MHPVPSILIWMLGIFEMKSIFLITFFTLFFNSPASGSLIYQNNFDTPLNWTESTYFQDMSTSTQTINDLYGSNFKQEQTVESIKTHGGSYYSDPSGIGGNFAITMLSTLQNDKLFLTFDVLTNFVNIKLDLSNIGARKQTGGFHPGINSSTAPTMKLSLYNGIDNLGSLLSSTQITGTSTINQSIFDWTNFIVGLDTTGNTGKVTLEFDLLAGDFAAIDNLTIFSSDTQGQVSVPEPTSLAIFGLGLAGLGFSKRRKNN